MKSNVRKTVGVYERPAKPKGIRVAVILAVLIAIIIAAVLGLRFFGEAQAGVDMRQLFVNHLEELIWQTT